MIGQTLGNYVIRQQLGEGGMGVVYLAEHPQIGKKVALKVLHAELSTNREIATRFFHEAKAVNDIAHPNIVDILDFGHVPTPDGQMVYLVMELLNGSTLTDVLAKGPMDPRRAVAIAVQVADALAASHARGIVHRDLKPDNIMLVTRGRDQDFVKLLDFGIAKVTDSIGGTKTRTGMVMGTPYYMSPEQCEGRGAIDHRADIYALGIVLYEMLSGRVPFSGEGFGEILVKQMTEAPAPLSSVRPGLSVHLEQVVLKAIQKRAAERFQSMQELVDALSSPEQFVANHGGLAAFPTPVPASANAATRVIAPHTAQAHPTTLSGSAAQMASVPQGSITRRRGLLVVGGLVGVAAIGAAIFVLQSRKDETTVAAADQPTPVETQRGSAPAAEAPKVDPQPSPPATPTTVRLTVDSRPPGAQVYFGTEDKPRCTSPCGFDVPRATSDATLTLKHSDFAETSQVVNLSSDQRVEISLAEPPAEKTTSTKHSSIKPSRSKPSQHGTSTQKKPGSVGDNTLNPFDQ